MSAPSTEANLIEHHQVYLLALSGMSQRALRRHIALADRVRQCGAIHDPAFIPRLRGVRSAAALEHALEQWEAEVASRLHPVPAA